MSATIPSFHLNGSHGGQGSQPTIFSRLVEASRFDALSLKDPVNAVRQLANAMNLARPAEAPDDVSDAPDEQENPFIPAGYTYFGQFVDHDLTFDTQSTLDGKIPTPNNERTPRLDLDCLYGPGLNSAPFMYDEDGRLLTNKDHPHDLARASNDRAIIGDPRNDENSIVCQMHPAFIHFHNKVIDCSKAAGKTGTDIFEAARREVRFTYQRIVVEDFLRRIIRADVYDSFVSAFRADPSKSVQAVHVQ